LPEVRDNGSRRRIAVRSAWGVVAAAGIMALAVETGSPLESPAPPESVPPGSSCTTAECHTGFEGRKHRHWAWEDFQQDCDDCHEREGAAHEFSMEDPPALCMTCHDPVATAANVHDPAAEDCLDCHDPHGSDVEGILVEPMKVLCFDCHDEEILGGEHRHDPAASGECTECHDPHSSPNASLLVAAGNQLCADCHDDVVDSLETAEYAHDPAEEDCTNCHDPHSGPHPYMLPEKGRRLCDECHDDIVEIAEGSSVDHGAALEGDECLSCHSPHAADTAPLLIEPQVDLCLTCHDENVVSDGERLDNIKEELDRSAQWHSPIAEDGCVRCHDPHGTESFRLLKEPFPESFYNPFSVETYGLCFSCHEKTLAIVRQSRTATNFRDGDLNLHYLHVNKEKKGRSCRACHAMHASANPLQVAEEVHYGGWLMPISFEKSETGGSCHPGCHEAATYDRRTGSGELEGAPHS